MGKDLYIVHCVDTEGPLYESKEATFLRLKEIFGIELDATKGNLEKLQNCQLDLGGREKLVADAFAEKRIATLETWTELDKALDELLSEPFRTRILDSDGNGWIFNWFCLNHVGFGGKNPRRRDAGYGNVFHHYISKLKECGCMDKDLIQFHYHPLPFNGHYNYCGTAYVNSNNIFDIIAHHIIDDEFFPASYRAGMEAERPDSHWFLEQWIPFDYSNDSFEKGNDDRQPDLRNGRYGDWRRASRLWKPYHPAYDDYQMEGQCHRWITRCVSLDSRVSRLEKDDIRAAFKLASDEGKAILSFANHDFRDMREEVRNCMDMIAEVSGEYEDVRYHYANSIDAMHMYAGNEGTEIGFSVSFDIDENNKSIAQMKVSSEQEIFGSQPFLAFKTKSGQYLWDNFDYGYDKKEWHYTFDEKTMLLDSLENVSFAANSRSGYTEIVSVDLTADQYTKIIKFGHRLVSRKVFKNRGEFL